MGTYVRIFQTQTGGRIDGRILPTCRRIDGKMGEYFKQWENTQNIDGGILQTVGRIDGEYFKQVGE